MTPDQGLSSTLFTPLLAVLVIYLLIRLVGQLLKGPRGAKAADISFVVLLVGSAYVLALLIYAAVSKFGLLSDMVIILAILFGFFAVLLVGLLAIFDLGIGGISRARAQRRRDRPG